MNKEFLDTELLRSFFLVWSIYEAKCFNGFVRIKELKSFVDKIEKSIDPDNIENEAEYFHKRYQEGKLYKNLIFGNKYDNPECRRIIEKRYADLTIKEKLYLLAFVTYRYRNYIFKGIQSWLQVKDQIEKCISILQTFISAYLNCQADND
jgi:hypothetical protein